MFSRWPSSSNVPLVNINTFFKNRRKIIEERKFLTRFEKMNPRLVIQVKKIVSKLSVGGRWLIGWKKAVWRNVYFFQACLVLSAASLNLL